MTHASNYTRPMFTSISKCKNRNSNGTSKNNNVGPKSAQYLGTKDIVDIQLDNKNFVRGQLSQGKSILILFDSGATKSIINANTIRNSSYLRQLKQVPVDRVTFKLGNGQFLNADHMITFTIRIQGNPFEISTLIVPNLTSVDLILGTQTLKDLAGTLDFSNNCFTIKPKTIYLHTVSTVTIPPRQKRNVILQGHFPCYIRNSEVVLNATHYISKLCPTTMLVKLYKGRTRISFNNRSNKCIVLHPNKPAASLNMADIVTITQKFDIQQSLRHLYMTNNNAEINCNTDDIKQYNLSHYPHLDLSDPLITMTEDDVFKTHVNLDKDCVLDPSQKQELRHFLKENRDAFSLYGEISGCPNFAADITLTDENPFFIRPYHLSDSDKRIVATELDKLVRLGILAVGSQSYTSPVFLVSKKGTNDKRVVTDFRFLNHRIKRMNHPFPLLHDTLRTIGHSNAQILSVLDLKSAFFCLPLTEHAQKFTGIASYNGGKHYYYKRLPQGLNISPAIFQAKIDEVLATVPNSTAYCIAHHDDIIVYSSDIQSHFVHLQSIFRALISHGLRISPKKCNFFKNSVTYMGHRISIDPNGTACIQPLADRCAALSKTKPPTSAKEVKRFVGAVNYVSSFFPHVQTILKPLHRLSRKRKEFIWTEEHQLAFDNIKSLLCKPPILHMPRKVGQLTLYSDTSRIATGSYLTQTIDNNEVLLGYYSKVLPSACMRYSVTELELFGLYINILGFKHLLKDIDFNAFVDHAAIPDILHSKHEPPTSRIRKLLLKLSEFTFKVGYKKGSEIVLADYLSRAPQPDDCEIDKIEPLAFNCNDTADTLHPVVTRSKAKSMGITIPSFYPPKSTPPVDITVNPQPRSLPVDNTAPDISSPAVVRRPKQPLPSVPPPPQMSNPAPLPLLDAPEDPDTFGQPLVLPRIPVERIPVEQLPVLPEIPNNIFVPRLRHVQPIFEPRLVDRVQQSDVFREPPPELYTPPQPLIPEIKDMVTRHIPKQNEIDRVMRSIKAKIIKDYDLPYKAKQLQTLQETSPYFKPIYDFLAHNILPDKIKAARSVQAQAEHYILCNGLLFRLFLNENNPGKMTLQLVIPDVIAETVISQYHDTLLSNHQGVLRTYLTIRRQFYMRNMFQKISNYIQACLRCQQFRDKPDKVRPFHMRVPDTYRTFDKFSLDFKSMPSSPSGFKHLMVMCDETTRFVVCASLKTLDAPSICEAILQKIVNIFGPPSCIITDAASALTGKLLALLCTALHIDRKVISVSNHGSLQVERHIQTLSKFIKINLNQFGTDWVRFVPTVCYAYNSFSSPHLGDHSPYELALGYQPPNMTGITFDPLSGLSQSYGDYADMLKKRFDLLSRTSVVLQKQQQEKQNVKITSNINKSPIYSAGQLVYLYKPTSSSLTANSKKIAAEWCGPLVIHKVLDRTHYILATLKGEILHDVFNYNRLKPCFLRASSERNNITHVQRLKQVLQNDQTSPVLDSIHMGIEFQDENDEILPPVTSHDILSLCQTDPVDLEQHIKLLHHNKGLATPIPLNTKQIIRQYCRVSQAPVDDISVIRARYKLGRLQLLTQCSDDSVWWPVDSYAHTSDVINFLLENNVQICGKPHAFLKLPIYTPYC